MSIELNLNRIDCFRIGERVVSAGYSGTESKCGYEFYLGFIGNAELSQKISAVSYPPGTSAEILGKFTPTEFCDFIGLTYPTLVTLDDGSHKLCINFSLRGGGRLSDIKESDIEENGHLTDSQFGDAVIAVLPKDTYSTVNVATKEYDFAGFGSKLSRIITLDPHDWKVFQGLRKLLISVGFRSKVKVINGNLIGEYLLGHLDVEGKESEKLRAEKEIQEAFKQRREMIIYLSYDWENIQVKFGLAPKGGCQIQ